VSKEGFTPPLLKNIATWEYELQYDEDRTFILEGIKAGFSLVDSDVIINELPQACVSNSASLRSNKENKRKLEEQITHELMCGNYIICHQKPKIVSAINSIPKPNGTVRLIHDLSRPVDTGLNAYASKGEVKYQTLSDAVSILRPGWFMAKIDLQSAYRSVHIPVSEHGLTGLSWIFEGSHKPVFMSDTRLPFGARKSPGIFNRLTQSIRRMMARRGFTIVAYLDDFFLCGPNFHTCLQAYNTLIRLLRQLGFQVNWNKVTDPCQRLCFLGVVIDTVSGTLSLNEEKRKDLVNLLCSYQTRTRANRRSLESLAGKLTWAALVTPWGRAHTRETFSLLSTLKQPSHKAKLHSIKADIDWWLFWLRNGTNARRIWLMSTEIYMVDTDACSLAGGAFCGGDWLYSHWRGDMSSHHINTKELAAVVLAARRWSHLWSGHKVIIRTDNTVTQAVINNGTALNHTCLMLLKEIAHLALHFNFTITAIHIPGRTNILADCISRLHERSQICKLAHLLCIPLNHLNCTNHMSHSSWQFIQQMQSRADQRHSIKM